MFHSFVCCGFITVIQPVSLVETVSFKLVEIDEEYRNQQGGSKNPNRRSEKDSDP